MHVQILESALWRRSSSSPCWNVSITRAEGPSLFCSCTLLLLICCCQGYLLVFGCRSSQINSHAQCFHSGWAAAIRPERRPVALTSYEASRKHGNNLLHVWSFCWRVRLIFYHPDWWADFTWMESSSSWPKEASGSLQRERGRSSPPMPRRVCQPLRFTSHTLIVAFSQDDRKTSQVASRGWRWVLRNGCERCWFSHKSLGDSPLHFLL